MTFIPVSALKGDNVVVRSEHTPWYEGATLLSHLERLHVASDRNFVDVRFPVQYVIRPQSHEVLDYRGYAGTVASGVLKAGDQVVALPPASSPRSPRSTPPTGRSRRPTRRWRSRSCSRTRSTSPAGT